MQTAGDHSIVGSNLFSQKFRGIHIKDAFCRWHIIGSNHIVQKCFIAKMTAGQEFVIITSSFQFSGKVDPELRCFGTWQIKMIVRKSVSSQNKKSNFFVEPDFPDKNGRNTGPANTAGSDTVSIGRSGLSGERNFIKVSKLSLVVTIFT